MLVSNTTEGLQSGNILLGLYNPDTFRNNGSRIIMIIANVYIGKS